jgi:hypothetical protein
VLNPLGLIIREISLLLSNLLAFSTFAYADIVVLDCNVEGGDQEVRVLDGAHGLQLEELTMSGTWRTRPLTVKEWESKNLRLRGGLGETYLLSYDAKAGRWFYESAGPGMRLSGLADCI